MKKLKINKKNMCIIISIFLIIAILFGLEIIFKSCFNKPKESKKEFYQYKNFLNINNMQNYFSNRKTLIIEETNSVLVGRNEKELENGYYDIKLDINKDNVCIIINNLQKKDVEFRSISSEYLNELEQLLIDLFGYNNIDELINIIQEEYNKLRSNIECATNIVEYRKINIDKYVAVFSIDNNMLRIDIKV